MKQRAPDYSFSADLDPELKELLPGYVERRKLDLPLLRQALQDRNFKKLETAGHQLKGTAPSYGLIELGSLGSQLEEAARSQSLSEAAAALESMEDLVESLDEKIPS